MTAPKTDRRILRTRALLRQGLAELMQEKSAGDITVKELVAHANVNRSTFYLHYTDIDQMLASVEAELLERIEASVQAHPIDPHQAQIFPLVGDLFALMAENREICARAAGSPRRHGVFAADRSPSSPATACRYWPMPTRIAGPIWTAGIPFACLAAWGLSKTGSKPRNPPHPR